MGGAPILGGGAIFTGDLSEIEEIGDDDDDDVGSTGEIDDDDDC